MFYWGYDNYMTHAFPFDELDPIECLGRGHDWKNPLVNNHLLCDFSTLHLTLFFLPSSFSFSLLLSSFLSLSLSLSLPPLSFH